jgi:type VI secretion system protein ImpA
MSGDIESLCEPITAEAPCGADLEDTPLLASFDAFRVFGSSVPLPSDIDWRALRERSFGALEQSRDIRLLAHLAAATVRIDGLPALCSVLIVADRWLSERWESVFPRVEEDAILRKNALNCFADRMAVVDALRRAPISAHRQLGAFSLRDLELASGQLAPSETDTNVPNSAQIEATLAGSALEDLAKLSARVTGATAALRNIVATMQTRAGFESAPDLDAALKPLSRIETLLSEHVRSRAPA